MHTDRNVMRRVTGSIPVQHAYADASIQRALRVAAGSGSQCHEFSWLAFRRALRVSARDPCRVIQHTSLLRHTHAAVPARRFASASTSTLSPTQPPTIPPFPNQAAPALTEACGSIQHTRATGRKQDASRQPALQAPCTSGSDHTLDAETSRIESIKRHDERKRSAARRVHLLTQGQWRDRVAARPKDVPSWMELYEAMCSLSHSLTEKNFTRLEIRMDSAALQRLYESIQANEGRIPGHKEVHVTPPEKDSTKSIMTAIGSPDYIHMVKMMVAKRTLRSFPMSKAARRTNPVLDNSFPQRLRDLMPENDEWTSASFLAIVRKLVRFNPPILDREGSAAKKFVPQALIHLFESVLAEHPVATEEAYNRAITELLLRRRIPDAQRLLFGMYAPQPTPSTTTINCFLRFCRRGDHRIGFSHYISLMSELRLRPDSETWAHLLHMASSEAERNLVVRQMATLGHMDLVPGVVNIAGELMSRSIDHVPNADDLVSRMQEMAGNLWFNWKSIHGLLDHLCGNGHFTVALGLLRLLHQRKLYAPRKGDVAQLVHWARRLRRPDLAVSLLQEAAVWKVHTFGSTVCNNVFDLAWSMRKYNMMKVVWQYSLLFGHLEQWMVIKGLWGHILRPKHMVYKRPETREFLARLVPVLLGRDLDARESAPPNLHEMRVVATHVRLEQERVMAGQRPIRRFEVMLEKACKMDAEWEAANKDHQSPAELAAASIVIPLRSKRVPRAKNYESRDSDASSFKLGDTKEAA